MYLLWVVADLFGVMKTGPVQAGILWQVARVLGCS